MHRFKIKRLLALLFLCLYSSITFCQNTESNHPYLQLSDCLNIDRQELPEAIPSLMYHKTIIENDNLFDEKSYSIIIMELMYYYSNIKDLASVRQIFDDAIVTLNNKSKTYNGDLRRQLYIWRGNIESELGNIATAISYLNYAKGLYEDANDINASYTVLLNNIAICYLQQNNLILAKLYIDEAIENYEKEHGNIIEAHTVQSMQFLNSKGVINAKLGKHDIAKDCFYHIIDDYDQSIVTSPEIYWQTYKNLLDLLFLESDINGIRNILGNADITEPLSHIHEGETLYGLLQFYLITHDWAKAERCLTELNKSDKNNIINVLSAFPEDEREKFWINISTRQLSSNNAMAFLTQNPTIISQACNNSLLYKNLDINIHRILWRNKTKANNYSEYNRLRQSLSYKKQSEKVKDSLRTRINNIETSILRSVGDISHLLENSAPSWEDIHNSLENDEIAIEFCMIPIIDSLELKAKQYYGAYIIRKEYQTPVLVLIGARDSIDNMIGILGTNELSINNMYSTNKSMILYQLIWNPLQQYLKNIKTIYYSPTDAITGINLDVLQLSPNNMMLDKYKMCRLSSTGKIPQIKHKTHHNFKNAVLYGNINYDASVQEMEHESSLYAYYSGTSIDEKLMSRSADERGSMKPLLYTKSEIDVIQKHLQNINIDTKTFEGAKANEESFKAFDGDSPELIHLATHGFSIYTPQKAQGNNFISSTYSYSDKEAFMMWSGLMMAGSNNIWSGNQSLKMIEDGILTADEISRLDLSNTTLVVLSACETAKGQVDPVDGVIGLQRAFKKAGAETIVMSLWEVQDDATFLLMSRFYLYLTSGAEKHDALYRAMLDVRKEFIDPYYWAGFIMLD